MVMRGDGGATDLAGFRREPARTLYSGPAASVAGALRYTGVADGVVVEVGGTSTNVAGDQARAADALVRPGRLATRPALRALDVRVVGVAGGSMLRARARERCTASDPAARTSPGCPTPASPTPPSSTGRPPSSVAPRPGDPADYLVDRAAATAPASRSRNTCAANLLGIPEPRRLLPRGDPARRPPAFELAGRTWASRGEEVARRMLCGRGDGGARRELVDRRAPRRAASRRDRRGRRRRRRARPPRRAR